MSDAKTAAESPPGRPILGGYRLPKGYAGLEAAISFVLLVGMIGVILIATVSFMVSLAPVLLEIGRDHDYAVFQGLFDKALAALIALELAHSVHQAVLGKHGLIQVRTVVLIGILAVVRKFVLIDIETTSGMMIMSLGVAVLALGVVYALTHWIETRLAPKEDPR